MQEMLNEGQRTKDGERSCETKPEAWADFLNSEAAPSRLRQDEIPDVAAYSTGFELTKKQTNFGPSGSLERSRIRLEHETSSQSTLSVSYYY